MPNLNLLNATAIKVSGGNALALKGQGFSWGANPPAAARPTALLTEDIGSSAHSLLDTATGVTGYHGGNLATNWTGTIQQTYWGGSYLSYRWGLDGPDRTATSYAAFVFTEMADFASGYADPATTQGIETLQYAFWHVLNAQSKGARFAIIWWAWSPPGTTAALDDDTMSKAQYLRQWLQTRPEITIPVYVAPTAYFIRQVIGINATYNPGWDIFADEIGHLNSSWQEVDEGCGWLLWMMLRGVKAPDDGSRSAFLQAIIDEGWSIINQYEFTGYGSMPVAAYPVATDPLPNPAPLGGGSLTAPTVTENPSFAPTGVGYGELATLFLGSATGNPTPTATWSLTLDGVDISAQVSGSMDITLDPAGTYRLAVTWANSEGSVAATTAVLTVSDGTPNPSDITGGENTITITTMTTPDALTVTGGENIITLDEAT